MRILYEYNYTEDEIKIANRTSRAKGASAVGADGSVRSVVARWVMDNVDTNKSILDFGAGSEAVQSQTLISKGYKNITAYDFGSNVKDGLHDPGALKRKYDVVFASNVINTSSSKDMLISTIEEIVSATKDGGVSVFNYPSSPRKLGLNATELKSLIQEETGFELKLVGGTNSTPIWQIIR